MCSEIDRFSSFLRTMSGSDKPQTFPIEKQEERESIAKLGNSSQPTSENLDSSAEIASEIETVNQEKGNFDHQNEPAEEINNKLEETDKATVSHTESEKQTSEDDDGFKTPTSSDHRIPAATQCPPAPKKPRPPPPKLKRKASPPPTPGARRSLQLDASTAEVESIFRPIGPNEQDDTKEQKFKKARRDDEDPS